MTVAERVRKRTSRISFSRLTDVIHVNAADPQLEVQFDITQRLTPDPNACRLRIANLGPATRGWLQSNIRRSVNVANTTIRPNGSAAPPGVRTNAKRETHARSDVYVELEAGYDDRTGTLFEGSAQRLRHIHSRANWQTDITVGDALASQMGAVASRQFARKSRLIDVLRHLVAVMGLGNGNLDDASLTAAIGTGKKNFPLGLTVVGMAKWYVDRLLQLTGAEWFVDAGDFFIVQKTFPLDEPEILISPDNGLIGKPQPTESNGVSIGLQLRTDVRIGRKVRLESNTVNGVYRVDELKHVGNNRRGRFMTGALLQVINPVPAFGGA